MLSNHSQDQIGHLTGLWDVAVFIYLPGIFTLGQVARAVNSVLNEKHPGLSEGQSWQGQRSRRPR